MVSPIGDETLEPTPTNTLYTNVLGMSTKVEGGIITKEEGLDLDIQIGFGQDS